MSVNKRITKGSVNGGNEILCAISGADPTPGKICRCNFSGCRTILRDGNQTGLCIPHQKRKVKNYFVKQRSRKKTQTKKAEGKKDNVKRELPCKESRCEYVQNSVVTREDCIHYCPKMKRRKARKKPTKKK